MTTNDSRSFQLPSSNELGALFQDALYEQTGLQAVYLGESLQNIAALDRQSWIPFEGSCSGAWRLRWDSALENDLESATQDTARATERMVEILQATMRRWSASQQSLGPVIMGNSQASPPVGVGPNPGPGASASMIVKDLPVEVCLFDCRKL